MDKTRHKEIKGKERTKKTKFNATAKDAERMRQEISRSWKTIDAQINYFWKAYGSDTPLFYQTILLPLKIRYVKWCATNERRTLRNSHKIRPRNHRQNNPSKGRKVVSRTVGKTQRVNKNRPHILPKYFGKSYHPL